MTELFRLIRLSAVKWVEHRASRLGAAIAFYALLSVAPLMILLVTIVGLVLGESGAEGKVLAQAYEVLGPQGMTAVQSLIENSRHAKQGIWADALAVVILFSGASGVFIELRDALNAMWGGSTDQAGAKALIWERLVAVAMILATGFLLLVSLSLSTALALLEKLFSERLPMPAIGMNLLNTFIFLGAVAVVFALVFRFVPNVRLAWRDVWVGAAATSLLFTVGKIGLAKYLSTTAISSAYGAAGSLVVLISWVYYSAQIFLFGAAFTYVHAEKTGTAAHRSSIDA